MNENKKEQSFTTEGTTPTTLGWHAYLITTVCLNFLSDSTFDLMDYIVYGLKAKFEEIQKGAKSSKLKRPHLPNSVHHHLLLS